MGMLGIAGACEPDLPPGLGDRIPDARLEVIEPSGSAWSIGTELDLSGLEGKPIVLDFWASWCGPCRQQHEYVSALKAKYGDRIHVVGVLHEDSEEAARVWLRREGATYPTVREPNRDLSRTFWVRRGLPRFVLLTPDRRLSWDFLGAAVGANSPNADSVAARIGAMLES